MKPFFQRICAVVLVCLTALTLADASAYDNKPKLVVVIIIDQFRGDYLDRIHDQLGQGGFRMFTDLGANFVNCYYDYANTETGPGHATLFTGAYSNGHGILTNDLWDEKGNRWITAVTDDTVHVVGMPGNAPSASPRNLLSETIGDELKLSTQNRSRVYTISLKDRAAILPAGFSADGAFWVDQTTGTWISSTFYMQELPKWVEEYNSTSQKYWDKDWKDSTGKVLDHTTHGPNARFYSVVGGTPFANDYEFDFAKAVVTNAKLGEGPTTDFLVISLSANDILGHRVGPDDPKMKAMWLDTDRQLAGFFSFLGQKVGLANVWVALSADHGVAPVPEAVHQQDRLESGRVDTKALIAKLNAAISKRLQRSATEFVHANDYDFEHLFLNEQLFADAHLKEADAERLVGEELLKIGYSFYYTKSQLQAGEVPNDDMGRRMLHTYSPSYGWWVLGYMPPFEIPGTTGTSHGTPYSYDRHVPLAFFGVPFQPGTYRTKCETVDMVATLSSLLGINAPSKAVGRVLTEGLRTPERSGR